MEARSQIQVKPSQSQIQPGIEPKSSRNPKEKESQSQPEPKPSQSQPKPASPTLRHLSGRTGAPSQVAKPRRHLRLRRTPKGPCRGHQGKDKCHKTMTSQGKTHRISQEPGNSLATKIEFRLRAREHLHQDDWGES